MAEVPPKPAADGSRRVYVLWGVGLGFLAALGLVCWLFVTPFLRARAIIHRVPGPALNSGMNLGPDEAVELLGGPNKALFWVKFYLRLPERWAPRRSAAVTVLGRCGKPAVPGLVNALQDENVYVREEAAYSLRYIGVDAGAAVPALIRAMAAKDRVSMAACSALADIGPVAVPELVAALKDGHPAIRAGAASALGYMKPKAKATVPALALALSDAHSGVRYAAADALLQIGPDASEAAPELEKALGDKDPDVRSAAKRALEAIAARKSLPPDPSP